MVYDINLIPSAKRNEKSRTGFQMTLLGILVAVVMVVCFFIYPMQYKVQLMNKLQEQEQTIASYANVEEEYVRANEEVAELNGTVSLLQSLHDNKKDINKILDQVESSMPKLVTLKSITAESGLVTLNGASKSYKEIAQFIVNLRSKEDIKEVTFTTASIQDTYVAAGDSKQAQFDFTVYIKHDFNDIIGGLQVEGGQ